MKGILLHGGSGTRLRPLTYTDVKQLLPIAGKPISEYALENMIDIVIKEINIVIGSIGGEETSNFLPVLRIYTFQETKDKVS